MSPGAMSVRGSRVWRPVIALGRGSRPPLKCRKAGPQVRFRLSKPFEAPRVGLEPTTLRLTAACSTIELPRKNDPWVESRRAKDTAHQSTDKFPGSISTSHHTMGFRRRNTSHRLAKPGPGVREIRPECSRGPTLNSAPKRCSNDRHRVETSPGRSPRA